ncbi:hypothetical protein FQR65_LT18156 [Abscondita terminalis]|nr:hypothetical protein FQR65_LT18156 [Abscondita terminalis]
MGGLTKPESFQAYLPLKFKRKMSASVNNLTLNSNYYYYYLFLADIKIMEIFDDLELLDLLEDGFPRRVYDRNNYFDEMDNTTFFRRFRLSKPTVLELVGQIEEHLEFPDDRNNALSPINQVLTCLRCYATGAHLSSVADFMGIAISSASRTVKKVSEVIASLRPHYINMPVAEEVVSVAKKFYDIASFPRVLGCVDGTHIRIQSPGGHDAELFRNRKGYFSLNCQVIGDADLRIRDVVARWPGSSHDQTIFNHSRIRARFENIEFPNSLLLGDSGYALKNYLLTPLPDPQTRAEQLYNEAHIRTRNSIERLFGVWKRRFPILAYGCRLKLSTILTIIPATAVLHNKAIDMKEELPPVEQDWEQLNYLIEMGNIPDIINHAGEINGPVFRNDVVNYFDNL